MYAIVTNMPGYLPIEPIYMEMLEDAKEVFEVEMYDTAAYVEDVFEVDPIITRIDDYLAYVGTPDDPYMWAVEMIKDA